jgi:hypothetical protein
MFRWRFCFCFGGTAATVFAGIAMELLQQRISAISNSAANGAQRTGFANLGSADPIGMNFSQSNLTKSRGRGFGSGAAQCLECIAAIGNPHQLFYRTNVREIFIQSLIGGRFIEKTGEFILSRGLTQR